MKKIRVGVIMGGKSIEREVSFNSGRTVCDHLDSNRYDIIPLFQVETGQLYILPWHFLHRGKISDFHHRLEKEAQRISWDSLKKLIDFMYIAVHGRYAEDGTLQGFLEVLHIPYLGSKIFGSALTMDKIIQKEFLKHAGINVARDIVLSPEQIRYYETHHQELLDLLIEQKLPFPLVAKPYKEGSSLGVSVVHNAKELFPALVHAATVHAEQEQLVLVEEKLEGMEFSCITITDKQTGQWISLPPTEIVIEKDTHLFDYEQKYMPGRATKYTPPRAQPEIIKAIQETCITASDALEITTMSRIDGFVTKDNRIVIVDPNPLSGMAPSSFIFREAAEIGLNHTQLINHLIESELKKTVLGSNMMPTQESSTPKIRVAVLMGGRSNEREVSLDSGRNVAYKLSPEKYNPIPLFVNKDLELYPLPAKLLIRNSTREIEAALDKSTRIEWNDLPSLADFVFIGLHGGEGENGAVQGTLEMLGIAYNGSSVLASALCMDKWKTNIFLKNKGFSVPAAQLISKEEWDRDKQGVINHILKLFTFPLIVKPHNDGCSVQVQKIKTPDTLEKSINVYFEKSDKQYVLLEKEIEGMELTVGVVGNEHPTALPPSQAVAVNEILSIEEKFLPGAGENQTPAPLPPETLKSVQETVEEAYAALDCTGYARIDCFYHEGATTILEVNSLPALTPATCIFHQAAEIGIQPMELIDQIITLGFKKHHHTRAHQASSSGSNRRRTSGLL